MKFPAATQALDGGTEIRRFAWHASPGGPRLAAATCNLPNTPQAEDHLMQRILFIDPKTTGGASFGSKQSRASSDARYFRASFAQDTAYLPVVEVWATPTGWTGGSGPSEPSNYGDSSINRWETSPNTGGYENEGVWPDMPCGVDGIGIDEPDSPLEEDGSFNKCPDTPLESICIDLFISRCSVLGLEGDCRNADVNAPVSASRAQIVIPVDFTHAGDAKVYVHESCIAHSTICVAPVDEGNVVQIAYTGAQHDTIAVHVSLENSITSLGGRVPTLATDANVVLVKQNGVWSAAAVDRNAFPTMQVNWTWGSYRWTLAQFAEGEPWAMIDRLHLRDRMALCIER